MPSRPVRQTSTTPTGTTPPTPQRLSVDLRKGYHGLTQVPKRSLPTSSRPSSLGEQALLRQVRPRRAALSPPRGPPTRPPPAAPPRRLEGWLGETLPRGAALTLERLNALAGAAAAKAASSPALLDQEQQRGRARQRRHGALRDTTVALGVTEEAAVSSPSLLQYLSSVRKFMNAEGLDDLSIPAADLDLRLVRHCDRLFLSGKDSSKSPMGPLWSFDLRAARDALETATRHLGLTKEPPTLYSARHTGASLDRCNGRRPLGEVQQRGRW